MVPAFGFLAGGTNAHVGRRTTHGLSLTCRTPWNGSVTAGAFHAGDRYAQLVGFDDRPWNFHLYGAYGRTVCFRYSQKFWPDHVVRNRERPPFPGGSSFWFTPSASATAAGQNLGLSAAAL
jgi:hypothetical protein